MREVKFLRLFYLLPKSMKEQSGAAKAEEVGCLKGLLVITIVRLEFPNMCL